jgi:hypothetical protein
MEKNIRDRSLAFKMTPDSTSGIRKAVDAFLCASFLILSL